MNIAPNEKFACFVFTRCSMADTTPAELELGPSTWATTTLDLKVAEHWAGWLGSITMEELKEASFVLYTTMPSARPKILDRENEDLTRHLDYLLYGLLLQGVPEYFKGYSLKGANVAGEVDVRQFSELKNYEPTYEMPEFRPGAVELKLAASLAPRVRHVNEGKADWPRLRRGLKALFRGTAERDGEERLHQFVRALEALLRPEIGGTRRQFAHRIDQTFTMANDEMRETLLQIFDMRSQVEHVHPVLDVLEGDEQTRIAVANRRTRQVDVLARSALRRVLSDASLLETFRTDAGIDAFWSLLDAVRVAAWGKRFDLRTVA